MKHSCSDENFDNNGVIWEPKSITIDLNGEASFRLTKLKLDHPKLSKSKIAKMLLEKRLLQER